LAGLMSQRVLYVAGIMIVVLVLWLSGVNGLAIVDGRSMEPLFHTGDVVVLVEKAPDEIEVNDVVVYKNPLGKYIIHRVIKIYEVDGKICYVIKGDNNEIPDLGFSSCPPSPEGYRGVPYEAIRGVVVSIGDTPVKFPYLGGITLLVRG